MDPEREDGKQVRGKHSNGQNMAQGRKREGGEGGEGVKESTRDRTSTVKAQEQASDREFSVPDP